MGLLDAALPSETQQVLPWTSTIVTYCSVAAQTQGTLFSYIPPAVLWTTFPPSSLHPVVSYPIFDPLMSLGPILRIAPAVIQTVKDITPIPGLNLASSFAKAIADECEKVVVQKVSNSARFVRTNTREC